jgi:hypothetical protein
MRILPLATEGFRRLSIALAGAAFLVVIGLWMAGELRFSHQIQKLCHTVQDQQYDTCIALTGPALGKCIKAAASLDCTKDPGIFPHSGMA